MGRYRQAGYQAEAVSRDKWGWEPPVIDENFEPERITLSLSIGTGNKEATIKGDDKKATITGDDKVKISDLQKNDNRISHRSCHSKNA